MALMADLILVRHVATDMAGCFCGHSDPDINVNGREQLRFLTTALKSHRIKRIYSSDLRRAQQTADGICNGLEILPILRSGLREISFGEWEGLTWNEIEQRDTVIARQWMDRFPQQAAPAGEEYNQFVDRIQSESVFLFEKAKQDCVLAVTHAGVIREILMRSCSLSYSDAWQWVKDYGAVVVIDQNRRCEVINEYCYKTR
jgi:alpha-ribazole phosphatase